MLNGAYTKDLKHLNRDMKDIVILDNCPASYALNQDNGLPIVSWFDDKTDCELFNIIPILEFLSNVPDIREFIPKMIINNEISYTKAKEVMNEYITSLQNTSVLSEPQLNPINPNKNTIKDQDILKCKPKSTSMNNKKRLLQTNNHLSATRDRPKMNLQFENKNISNSFLVSYAINARSLVNSIKKLKNNSDVSCKETFRKLNPKDINTFRSNVVKTEVNDIRIPNILMTDTNQDSKHKKVDSYTFGINQYTSATGLKAFKNRSNSNRKMALKVDNKLIQDNSFNPSFEKNKKFVIGRQTKHIRNDHLHFNKHLDKQLTKESSIPSTSMHLLTQSDLIARPIMNHTSTNRIFLKNENDNNSSNNNKLGSVSYDMKDTMKNTPRVYSIKNNKLNIIRNRNSIYPSHIRELKIEIKEYKNNQYRPNITFESNT